MYICIHVYMFIFIFIYRYIYKHGNAFNNNNNNNIHIPTYMRICPRLNTCMHAFARGRMQRMYVCM